MAITFAGCERNGEVILMGAFENGKITFFATARQLIIDWGDGSPLETYNDVNETIEHTHADNTTVQIKIMEKGLTTLKTKQLTSLYVNGCTALEYLDCEDDYQLTSLTATACKFCGRRRVCGERKFCVYLREIIKYTAMVIEIDKTMTAARLKQSLRNMKVARSKEQRANLSEFFGALPHIGDGLEFQKKARNEWN